MPWLAAAAAASVVVATIVVVAGFGAGTGATPVVAATPGEAPTTTDTEAASTPTRSTEASPAPAASASGVAESAAALATLAALPESDGRTGADYDRSRFGQTWADVDRNGCDTRNDILGRDLIDPVFKPGTRDCKVLGGTLIDPYDGAAVSFVSGRTTSVEVQIDHVVALGWAWRHGAWAWTDEQRTAFANDPRNLVAASEEMNQEKSDSGPGEWMPPVPELRCAYLERWVSVLAAYRLGVDPADRAAAVSVLRTC